MRATDREIFAARDGVTYRLTTTSEDGLVLSGLVVAEVHPPRVEIISGRVLFTLVDPLNNELTMGAIRDDFEIEEVGGPKVEIR